MVLSVNACLLTLHGGTGAKSSTAGERRPALARTRHAAQASIPIVVVGIAGTAHQLLARVVGVLGNRWFSNQRVTDERNRPPPGRLRPPR